MKHLSTTAFWEKFNNGELAFFAGSGICYDAGQPSAHEVLRHTLMAALPHIEEPERELLLGIQPEVFYEALLGHAPRDVALRPWLALHPEVSGLKGSPPQPNVVHRALMQYSAQTGIPVFTTNFDTLFETAAHQEGFLPRVLLPDAPYPPSENVPTICKLHGSISDQANKPDLETLYTTMTAITRANTPWIEALVRLMKDKHLCFLGYSGKDIDLFPFLQRAAVLPGHRFMVWVTQNFATDPCLEQANRAQAWRLEGAFPGELFAKRFGSPAGGLGTLPDGPKNALAALAAETEDRLCLTDGARETLRAQLHGKLGGYAEAYRLSAAQLAQTRNPGAQALLLHARLAHEQAFYRTSARCALRAVFSRDVGGAYGRVDVIAMGFIAYAESCRMRIPFDTYFDPGPASRSLQALPSLGVFLAVSALVAVLRAMSANGLCSDAEHDWIEHRIRLLSLLQGAALAFGLGAIQPVRNALKFLWMSLKTNSYTHGYAAGIANCHKFADRLDVLESACSKPLSNDLATNIYNLTTSRTGQELLLRNRANACMAAGAHADAEEVFAAMRTQAQQSGNRLNQIKALLGMARARCERGCTPGLEVQEANELAELIAQLEPGSLRRHLHRTLRRVRTV